MVFELASRTGLYCGTIVLASAVFVSIQCFLICLWVVCHPSKSCWLKVPSRLRSLLHGLRHSVHKTASFPQRRTVCQSSDTVVWTKFELVYCDKIHSMNLVKHFAAASYRHDPVTTAVPETLLFWTLLRKLFEAKRSGPSISAVSVSASEKWSCDPVSRHFGSSHLLFDSRTITAVNCLSSMALVPVEKS